MSPGQGTFPNKPVCLPPCFVGEWYADGLLKAINPAAPGVRKAPAGLKKAWSEGGFDYEVRIHPPNPKYGLTRSVYRVARRQQGVNQSGQGAG